MAKGDKFFFDNFSQTAEITKRAAEYLVSCLKEYDPQKITQMLEEMHALEHSADKKKHEMGAALTKAFVTPIDREDLDLLSHKLDDVTDCLEEIIQKFYIYDIRSVRADAIEFSEKLVSACGLIEEAMAQFSSFKRSKRLPQLVIELNTVEEECDKLFLQSMRSLTEEHGDVLETISWRKIFECLEECADACEHVGECLGSVVMKNT